MASRHVSKAIVRAASVVVEGLETRRLLAYSVPGEYFDIGTASPSSKSTTFIDIKKDGASTTLEATGYYIARGVGSFTLAYQRKADSENYQRLPDKAWVPGTYGIPLELQGNSDPWIGGNPVANDFVYGKTFTVAADRPARTRIFDSDYSDNSGNLTIELYQALILDRFTVSDANDEEVSADGAMPPSTLDVRQKSDGTADIAFDAEFTDIQHMLTESSYVLWKVMNDQEDVLYSGSFFGPPENVNVNPVTQGGSLTTRFFFVAGVDVDRDGTLDNDEIDKSVQADLFNAPPPQLEDQVSASQNQRVDIHGVPLPDPSPTGESEADRIPNMAFIDAYGLTPSFSTTDVAVPMPGGELLMEFRRTMAVDSETTNLDPSAGINANAHFSGEKILGPGWSTNLNSRVMVTYTANPISGQSKLRATVFDETGSSLSYKHGNVSVDDCMTPDVRSTFSNAALKGKLQVTGTTLASGPLPDTVPTSFVLEKEHGTKLYFSRQGEIDRSPGLNHSNVEYYFRLDKIVDRNYAEDEEGNQIRGGRLDFEYGGPDPRLVTSIYDPSLGDETTSTRRLDFEYVGGLLTKVIDPLDREFKYHYFDGEKDYPEDPDRAEVIGRLSSVEKPPVADPVTGVTGSSGPKVQFDYDVEPRVQLTFRGTTSIYPTSVEGLDLKQTVTWTLPTKITDARGHDTTFEYDFKLLPSSITEEGGTLKYSWDYKPQVTSVTTDADGTATFAQTRDSFTHAVTTVTDTMNHVTVYDFDSDIVDFNNSLGFGIASDKVTRTSKTMRDASGVIADATVVYQYSNDVNANLVEVTDVSGNKVQYAYATDDSKIYNNPTSSVLAAGELGITTSYNYGPFRKLESQTDAEDKTTTYGFDAYGNRTLMTEPGGAVTTYEYDSRGFMTKQTDPDGRVTEFVANEFGNLEYTVVKGFASEDLTPLHGTSPFPLIDTDGKWLVSRRVADVMDRTRTEYDGRGNATSYAYDAWDRVTAVDLPEVIDPDWDPLVDGAPAPTVGGTSYTDYDFNSNVVKEVDELGNVTLNTYDDLNRKTETRRRMSSPTADSTSDIVSSWTYDDRGLTATSTDPLGRTTAYDYDQLLRSIKTLLPGVTEVTTPGSTSTNPATTVKEYVVKTFYGANSGSGAFTFGGFNPTRVINARGYATDTQYDDAYRAVKTIQREDNGSTIASTTAPRAGEPTVETQYNDVHMPVRVTTLNETRSGTQANRSSYTFYDERYRTTATVLDFDGDGAGITAGWFVSSGGTYSFDSDDFVTRTEYDEAGNAIAATDALGRRGETDYDGASRAIESRAPAVDIYVPGTGLVSNFIATTTTVYDQASQPILVTDARGAQAYTEYDARGRAILSVLDLNGNGGFSRIPSPSAADIITWTGYDLMGNTIYSIDPNGNRSDTEYDRAYRAIETQGPAVADAENGGTLTRPTTSTTYDNAGNVLTITDPRGLVTSTDYDEWNRARKVTANSNGGINDADRVTTESRYDASGNKLALVLHNRVGSTDRPQVTTYTYDAFDRQLSETLPVVDANDRITTTTYSRGGDVLTVVDPKTQSVETDFDRAGRVTEQRFKRANGTTEETRTSTYDKAGNLLSKTDLHGTSGYVYDALNRVIEEDRVTTTAGISDTSIVLSGYDASGNRSRVIYPEANGSAGNGTPAGRTLISTYDRANRMLQLDDSVTSIQPSTFDYDPAGNRKRLRAPNGVVTVTTFDAANRVLTHTATSDNGNGTVVYDLTYAYDRAGQRRSAEEFGFNHGTREITWDYDDVYRLTSESWTGPEAQTRTYNYDKAGNRTSQDVVTTNPGVSPGTLDASFGTSGTILSAASSQWYTAVATRPDGKILLAGAETVVQYNVDGTIDTDFADDGLLAVTLEGGATAMVLQSDGKVLVAGMVYDPGSGAPDFAVRRYNTDGELDATFGSGGLVVVDMGAEDYAHAVLVQPDGKVLVSGVTFDPVTGDRCFAVVRLDSDGALDTDFAVGGKLLTGFGDYDFRSSLALQSDGKIVIAGSQPGTNGYDIALTRYTSNGVLDTSFGTAGTVQTELGSDDNSASVIIQPDGKIVAAGYTRDADTGQLADFAMVRYLSDGTPDSTFGTDGVVVTDLGDNEYAYDVRRAPDGKIILAGYSRDGSNGDFLVARYEADGDIDMTFGDDGVARTDIGDLDVGSSLALQPDGKILLGGISDGYLALSRYVGGSAATSATTTFTYDDLNQLLSSNDGSATTTYTHDLNGNRVTKDISGDTATYVYDVSDRLIEAKDDNDDTIFSAAYDARTRRLAKTEGASTKLFRYDGGTNFQELTPGADADDDADNVLTTELIRAGGLGGGIGSVLYSDDIASSDPDSVEFFVYNAVGHTVALSDYSSAVTQSTLYEAFGDTVAQSGSSTNNRLRNTKERDASIGLDNDGFRYYDPATGRYISRDPIGYGDGMNVYASVGNDPLNSVDSLGLSSDEETTARVGIQFTFTGRGVTVGASVSAGYQNDFAAVIADVGVAARFGDVQGNLMSGQANWTGYASVTGILGSGNGDPLPNHLYDQNATSLIPNTFENSLSYSATRYFDSAVPDSTWVGTAGLRVGDVAAHYGNDSNGFPSFAGGGEQLNPENTDSSFTGFLGVDVATGGGSFLSAGQSTFTGMAQIPAGYVGRAGYNREHPRTGDDIYYPQDAYQSGLNLTTTSLRFTDPEGNFLQVGYRGNHDGQNVIHDHFGEMPIMGGYGVPLHRFEHNEARDGIDVQTGRREVFDLGGRDGK